MPEIIKPEFPDLPLYPTEGQKDCRYWRGEVGVALNKKDGTPLEIIKCTFREYQGAIMGVRGLGEYASACERCRYFESKK